jgi:hypothetical protein
MERALLSYMVLVKYPFPERHDVLFGTMLEES